MTNDDQTQPPQPRNPGGDGAQQPSNPWGSPQASTPGNPQYPGPTPPAGQPGGANPWAPQGGAPVDPYADPYGAGSQPAGSPSWPQPGQQQNPYGTGAPQPGQPQNPYAPAAQQPYTGNQNPGFQNGGFQNPSYPPAGAPFAGGSSSAPGAPRPTNKRPWIIGASALVGLLVLALLLSQCGHKDSSDPKPNSSVGASSSGSGGAAAAAGPFHSPSEAAMAFMTAWQKGDSATLLGTLMSPPSDTTFITDATLKAALAKAPVSDVKAVDTGENALVSWTMGGKPYTTSMKTYKRYDGTYQVGWYGTSTYFSGFDAAGLDVKINGTPLTDTKATLLPGVYDITVGNAMYAVSKPTWTVTTFNQPPSYNGKIIYSASGLKLLRDATAAKLKTCLAAKVLDNPSCGISFKATTYDGKTLDPKTMNCTVATGGSSLSNADFKPDVLDPTQAEAYVTTTLSCTMKATDGTPYKGTESLFKVTVDTGTKPVGVTFS